MRKITLILIFFIVLVFFFHENFAGTIKLRWDPVSDSDIYGYKIYYGYESAIYTYSADVGNVTTYTLTNLNDCITYYIAVTSYDFYRNESGYSNESSGWPRPVLESLSPSNAKQGETVSVTIAGINFAEGSYPEFDSPDIILNDYYRNHCEEIIAEITIAGGSGEKPAQIGFYDVLITNPGDPDYYREDVIGNPKDFEIELNVDFIDIDNNGKIDGLDLSFLALHFGTQEGDTYYESSVDFNGDGWIDGDDLSILSSHFGETLE